MANGWCRLLSCDSRSEYASRMHRVVEIIDRQLDRPLDFDTLAAAAHFSPFHFHRLFSAWMGETLGDYLRWRRAVRGAVVPRLHQRAPAILTA